MFNWFKRKYSKDSSVKDVEELAERVTSIFDGYSYVSVKAVCISILIGIVIRQMKDNPDLRDSILHELHKHIDYLVDKHEKD